jgi:hypothetical protein
VPGGTDIAALARDETALTTSHRQELQRLGASDLPDAEARHSAAIQLNNDIAFAVKALAMLAPKGLDALRAGRDAHTTRVEQNQRELDRLPPPETQAPVDASLAAATASLARNKAQLEQATQQFNAANQAAGTAQAQRDAAERESAALQAALSDPTRQRQAQANGAQLLTTEAEYLALENAIAAQHAAVGQARADILVQDVERLGRSAQQAQRLFGERQSEIRYLQGTLEDAGAQGLEEERAGQMLSLQAAQRRCEELQLRAGALDLLLDRLESHRRALTLRLQAPLQKHVQRYLQLLFPQAVLDIGENLAPGQLTRTVSGSTQVGPVAELSFGAREQMGVISRLAYADLLREAGRPTLIILDDALVHSDAQRLDQMKRVLFDAAQRHQVLLFTCHPDLWRDLGVAPRLIAATMAVPS